ncbi:MAG: polyprenyl synthetase family protein [Candidatus Bathyarchaeota archaeon]|nr:polyprenyl synthetase family protein [Candidatus Bathyarchaeota archaeon]
MDKILEEKGGRIRKKIETVLFSGVSDPEFLCILKEISRNWKDVYRPALTALSCEAVGGSPEATDDAGLMFALASAGFGLHDDIIDRSKRKHFGTTVLGRYGLRSALLVGDLLIVKAWASIQNRNMSLPIEKLEVVVEEYGRLNVEICEAEFMENGCRKKLKTDLKTYETILWKAMAELEACTRIGAIIGNGDDNEIDALAEFGRRLGFGYRLTDEVRDTLNLEGNLVHRLKYESVPLPVLFASKSSHQRHEKINSILQKKTLDSADIKELLEICFDSKALEYVFDLAKSNYEKNIDILSTIEPSTALDSLSSLSRQSFVNIADLIL